MRGPVTTRSPPDSPVLVFPPLYVILLMASRRRSLSLYEFSLNSVRASSLNWAMATWRTTTPSFI